MKYREGYKNQLVEDEVFEDTGIESEVDIKTDLISLTRAGKLTVRRWYAWDGASGPTIDRGFTGFLANTDQASLAHDALYQLMRMGLLPREQRENADIFLDKLLKDAGMWAFRRWYWLKGLERGGSGAADPKNRKPILTAP